MPIAHKYKLIFIHIPKTGGTSIEKALGIKVWNKEILRLKKEHKIGGILYAPHHYTSLMVKNHPIAIPCWDDYFKFSIVRHPYTRVLSEFWWVHRHKGKKFEFTNVGFNKHLKKYYRALDKDHKISQYDYLYDGLDNLLVDYVGKFEELGSVFKFLKNKFRLIPDNLPTIHKSRNNAKMLKNLTQGQKNFIYKLYQKDFEKFNYER